MKAVILAGGKGTRLKPLTANLPKPLVPILNTPLIDYSLALLARHCINEVAVTLQHLPEKIIDHLDASPYRDGLYYFMESAPLGTAGSVKNAEAFLDETFIAVSGDALTGIDIEKMLSYHRANRADITIAAKRVEDASQFGVICADSLGRVFGFKEKPKFCDPSGETVSCGIYIIEPHVLQLIPPNVQYDFARDLFPLMLDNRMRLFSYETEEYWCDVGNIGAYFSSNMDALGGRFRVTDDYGFAAGGRFIETEGAAVYVGGNVYIGDGVTMSGGVILGANVSVYSGAYLRDCIITEEVHVPAFARIENCILSGSYKIDISASNVQAEAQKDNIIPFTPAFGAYAPQ